MFMELISLRRNDTIRKTPRPNMSDTLNNQQYILYHVRRGQDYTHIIA